MRVEPRSGGRGRRRRHSQVRRRHRRLRPRRLAPGVGTSRSPKLQPLPVQRWQHPLWWETLRTAETARQEWAVQDGLWMSSYRLPQLTSR